MHTPMYPSPTKQGSLACEGSCRILSLNPRHSGDEGGFALNSRSSQNINEGENEGLGPELQ